jgi:hypothetical protein
MSVKVRKKGGFGELRGLFRGLQAVSSRDAFYWIAHDASLL